MDKQKRAELATEHLEFFRRHPDTYASVRISDLMPFISALDDDNRTNMIHVLADAESETYWMGRE